MTNDEVAALDAYAKSIEVTRAAVCSLVIQRELQVRRLSRASRLRRTVAGSKEVRRRVTVHVENKELKQAFANHVATLGLGSDEAALALFRKELKERWLFKMFGFSGNRG